MEINNELYEFIKEKTGIDIYFFDDESGYFLLDEDKEEMDDPTEVLISRLVNLVEELRQQNSKKERAFVDIGSVLHDSKQARSNYIKDIIKKAEA